MFTALVVLVTYLVLCALAARIAKDKGKDPAGYFFLALLPGGQRTRDVGGEAAHTRWASPGELAGDGTPMLPPTKVTLRQLARYPTIERVLAAAATREPGRPVQPAAELQPDGSARLVVNL